MKLINNTGKDLQIFIGKEGSDAAEIKVEIKDKEEVKVGEDDGMLYVITSS